MKICKICGKEFTDGRSLFNHSKLHNRNNTYQNYEWLYNQYWNLKKTQKQIARKCNTDQTNIHAWMRKLNISSRSLSETGKGNKNALGMKHSEKTKKILSEKFKGKKNPAWKGDEAGYNAFHRWIKKIKGIPTQCEKCGKVKDKRFELANISGEYPRDLNDYMYLCNRCHKIFDGTIYNILPKNRKYLFGGGYECL